MDRLRGLLFICLLLGCPQVGSSQAPADRAAPPASGPLRFEHLDSRRGLSHNSILTLLQDRQGFLWVGTSDGLNRYDGYTFTVYRHDPADSTSLSNNTVKVLLEDRTGTLWVGTDLGLEALDPRTGRFTRHVASPPGMPWTIWGMLEAPDSSLWIGMLTALIWYQPRTGARRIYFDQVDAVGLNLVSPYTMSLDEAGTLWVGAGGPHQPAHLYRYDAKRDTFEVSETGRTAGARVYRYAGTQDRAWVSAWVGQVGFLDRTGRPTRPVPVQTPGQLFLQDRLGTFWTVTPAGLVLVDPETGARDPQVLDASEGNTLSRIITTVYEDRAGAVWVGTLGGLYRHDPHAKPFRHLRRDPRDPASLSSDIAMAVQEDRAGALWVGTLGGGLNRVDRTTGRVRRYRHRAGDPHSLPSDDVWAVYEDRRGRIWLGTEAGLAAFDPRTGQFFPYPLESGDQPFVYVITEDATGRLWIGGPILYCLDPRDGRLTRYPYTKDATGLGSVNVQALAFDAAGKLWIGHEFTGFSRLDPESGRFTHYGWGAYAGAGQRYKAVRVIHRDRERADLLWLGTDMGLAAFDTRAETFRWYARPDQLPGSNVFAILEDDRHHLWLSTNRGLVRFDKAREHFRTYGADEGTGNTEYNRRAASRTRRGEFLFGGLDGVTAFFPDAIRDNPYVPPVVITEIRKSSREGTVRVEPGEGAHVALSYRDYSFSLAFAALSYTNPGLNRYAYRLEGFDRGWVEAGTSRSARYTNVPPGTYVFHVKGANNDGVWNEAGTALRITIAPPFWQTWWFRLLAVAALGALLTAAYRYRVARLLEMERMRLRIAGDLHDDIGSKLSSIALMSEMVAHRIPLEARERRQLAEITRAARTMADDLRDIVWVVRPGHDTLDNLVARMQNTTVTLLNGTSYTFQAPALPATTRFGMEHRRHLYLSYKEILNNVARHAHATRVDIRIQVEGDRLVLEVGDDGTGFDQHRAQPGFGLESLQARARALGGSLTVTSRPGAGTTVRLVARMA